MKSLFNIASICFLLFINTLSAQNNRPQEPIAPFNYTSEDVFFTNSKANNIKLAGTLTLPNDVENPPVVILISGSGPQNRNEELANHKPFLVLANYLTTNGIAVLRYDDRGIDASEGDFTTAISLDFATDVEAAINYLKTRSDVNVKQIGLIGHSEGGLIAPIVACDSSDVAFIVLLAGTGVDGKAILETQTRRMGELSGAPKNALDENENLTNIIYDAVKNNEAFEAIKAEIKTGLTNYKTNNPNSLYASMINETFMEQQANALKSQWLQTFIRTNPDNYLSKTKCPVLAINGSKDIQVLPKLNLEAIKNSLAKAKNKDVTIKELEGLNHLFQTAETGLPQEYATIQETFSPLALELIKNWINERF